MKQPWIAAVVGGLALLAVGVTLRQLATTARTGDGLGRPGAKRAERSAGWGEGFARNESEGPGQPAAAGGAEPGEGRRRGGTEQVEGGALQAQAEGHGAAVVQGARASHGGVGVAELAGGTAVRVQAGAAAGRENAQPSALQGEAQTGAQGGAGVAGAVPNQAANQAAGMDPDLIYHSDESARFDTASQVQVKDLGKISGDAGTLSFWFRPQWETPNQDDTDLLTLGDNQLHIFKNVSFLRLEFADQNGAESGTGASIAEWKPDTWYQVAVTWGNGPAGEPQALLFVNGQVVAQRTYTGALDLKPDAALFIGSNYPPGRPIAPGVIGGVQMLARTSGPLEVASQFEQAQPPQDN